MNRDDHRSSSTAWQGHLRLKLGCVMPGKPLNFVFLRDEDGSYWYDQDVPKDRDRCHISVLYSGPPVNDADWTGYAMKADRRMT